MEKFALFRIFQEIIDSDFDSLEGFFISIKFPLFEYDLLFINRFIKE